MGHARYIIGESLSVLRTLPDRSVHSVITSPPYWRKRAYLPAGDPAASDELGQEATPGEFLANLLKITDELWRVVRDDGTIWFNLGDTASGSGGSGGDYNEGGWREGQAKWQGSGRAAGEHGAQMPWKGTRDGHPRAKSVCWLPELFGASLAYGRNLLTGEPCCQWITRPPVTWCKPAPTPGEIIDKFREATELFVWAAKEPRYYFDLDAVRLPPNAEDIGRTRRVGKASASPQRGPGGDNGNADKRRPCVNPLGAPPLNWWVVNTSGYEGAHFATFPPELIVRPVIVSCPPEGTILDPFAGTGTTLAVATGHGRDAIGIDLDPRNAELACGRVGMFLDIGHHTESV